MFGKPNCWSRWLMLIASGAVLLQAAGCTFVESLQTALLAAIAGQIFYLVQNV